MASNTYYGGSTWQHLWILSLFCIDSSKGGSCNNLDSTPPWPSLVCKLGVFVWWSTAGVSVLLLSLLPTCWGTAHLLVLVGLLFLMLYLLTSTNHLIVWLSSCVCGRKGPDQEQVSDGPLRRILRHILSIISWSTTCRWLEAMSSLDSWISLSSSLNQSLPQ